MLIKIWRDDKNSKIYEMNAIEMKKNKNCTPTDASNIGIRTTKFD